MAPLADLWDDPAKRARLLWILWLIATGFTIFGFTVIGYRMLFPP